MTIDTTNPNADVQDKNVVPELDKEITGASNLDEDGKKAMAQVGTTVDYEATITVQAGAKGYEFHDKMDSALSYNNDVKVYVNGTEVAADNYTKNTAAGETITIQFKDEWIKTLAVGTKIVVKYSATVTSDALHTDPANNTAWLEYGDENSNNKTPESTTEVYNAKFSVTKFDGSGNPLAGAGFVLKNAEGKYYQLKDGAVNWVENIDEADEHISEADGNVPPFTGLAAGNYTLVEKTVPAGYNKAADYNFIIAAGVYHSDNLEDSTAVYNNAGTELPSTGGMGTTLFYVFGAVMMLGAAVLLVTKKRMAAAE